MAKAKGDSRGLAFLQAARPQAMDHLLKFFAESARHLDRKTRFLISVVTKVINFSPRGIEQYARRALAEGATADEVLDAVLCSYPCAGLTKVVDAIDVLLDLNLEGFGALGVPAAGAPALSGEAAPSPPRGETGAAAATLGGAATPGWVDVGAIEELDDSRRMRIQLGRHDVAVFRIDEDVLAIDNLCPHRGGPLVEGLLSGHVLACPLHHWRFDLRTGASIDNPGCTVRRYDVRVDGGRILLKV